MSWASGRNLLWRATGLTLNSNSDSVTRGVVDSVSGAAGAPIDISKVSNGLLVVKVANAPTGTSPTLAVFFDCQDEDGDWLLTSNATSISGVALGAFAGVVYGNISTGYVLTNGGRVRWTLTGTSPSYTGVSMSLYGSR